MQKLHLPTLELPEHSSNALWKMFAPASDISGSESRVHYLNPRGGAWVTERTIQVLGISSTQLGKLLGCERDYVRQWRIGQRTPGPMYVARMFKLCDMKHNGCPVEQIKYIDWDTVGIVWKEGFDPHAETGSAAPVPGQELPDNQREEAGKVA